MFERYTESARRAVFWARYEASQWGSPQIEAEHLLLGILREDPQLAWRLFQSSAKIEAVRGRIEKHFPPQKRISPSVDLPLSETGKHALAFADKEATQLNHSEIGPEHLLLGIYHEESSLAAAILRENGIRSSQLRKQAIHSAAQSVVARSAKPPPAIEGLRDLIEEASKAESGPLIGRDREMERIIHILCRRTKNNPVLIGEAGVGKTAIVEGLARRMAEAEAPAALAERRLVALDASSLTGLRQPGRTFGPAKSVLAGLAGPPNAVLFVRGLFNLAAAGSAWAVVEAMHTLEPYLAQGRIQCIATGSPLGLRETIEKAGLLARHFEVVEVAPVSEEDAIRIVSGLKAQFEQFHEVTFDEGAIETAVYASGRFLPCRHLPDRAIDLIDEAAAAVRLRRESEPREVAEARRRIRLHSRAMEIAIAKHEFDKARRHSDDERREREELERLREQYKEDDAAKNTVTPEDIEAAVAARVGVPVAAVKRVLQQKALDELQRIAGELAAHVPVEAREWLPFLAAYLVRCSAAEAETLARVIAAAKGKPGESEPENRASPAGTP